MSISLDPLISLPDENEESYYPGYEDAKMLSHCSKWCNDLRNMKKWKGRAFSVFGENIKKQSVLLCKYLCPIKPPKEVCDLEPQQPERADYKYSIEKAAHFVSLIPFEADLKSFEDMDDLYCTCQEFLDLK